MAQARSVNGINGTTLGVAAVGAILLWSGIRGKSVTATIRSLIAGQTPSALPTANPILEPNVDAGSSVSAADAQAQGLYTPPGGSYTAGGGTSAQNQALGNKLAQPFGWNSGAEWNALVMLWNKESGWNNTALNEGSGAYGIAQALPASKYPPAGQASGGSSAMAQILWGLAYIKTRYGDPLAAWQHEMQYNWY